MLRYFRVKLFPNKTILFYRSQLHVPLYVRNRGRGSRYCGLDILIPTPDFCFWNYKKFSYLSKKCSDIFESNCFLTRLLYFIGHSYMFHCMSGIEGWGQDTFEIRNVVICQRRTQIILGDTFSSIVFSITTLFYQSQLHIPQYCRNIGWGRRYRGLGILTPTPDFCFWNYKNFSYVSKKCSDIF